ncbi:beta-ketoacyl reductase, partial [Streptomyces sp. NPDC001251]
NAFLDGLAGYRRAAGLVGQSLSWGLWAGEGMGGSLGAVDVDRMRGSGVHALTAEEGLALFDAAQLAGQAHLVPIKLDLKALRSAASSTEVPELFRSLIGRPTTTRRTVSTGSEQSAAALLKQQLAGLPTHEQESMLLDIVRTQAATILGHAGPQAVEPDRAFSELGFDSLSAVEFRNALGGLLGLRLPPTLIFDYPNARALADHIRAEVVPDAGGTGTDEGDVDAEIRAVLQAIPLTRLRDAGLLNVLLELGGVSPSDVNTGPDEDDGASADSIDDMDAESLISLALGGGEMGDL